MEPVGMGSEFWLRVYETLTVLFALMSAAGACCIILVYCLLLHTESSSLPRRPVTRVRPTESFGASRASALARYRPVLVRIASNFFPSRASRTGSLRRRQDDGMAELIEDCKI